MAAQPLAQLADLTTLASRWAFGSGAQGSGGGRPKARPLASAHVRAAPRATAACGVALAGAARLRRRRRDWQRAAILCRQRGLLFEEMAAPTTDIESVGDLVPRRPTHGPARMRALRRSVARVLGRRTSGRVTPGAAAPELQAEEEDEDAQQQREAEAWAQHLRIMLQAEWREELESSRSRLELWPIARLVAEGFAATGLRAEAHGRLFGRWRVAFIPADGCYGFSQRSKALRHAFRRGDVLIVTREGEEPLRSKLQAQVVAASSEAVWCTMRMPLEDTGPWRLDRGPNSVAYRRTMAAVKSFESGEIQAEVRSVLLESPEVEARNAAPIPLSIGVSAAMDRALNDAQRAAICSLEGRRLALIQGPPGCGKTRTACSLLRAAYRGRPLLAVADSNVAVDRLLEGLLELGVRAVRVGASPSAGTGSLELAEASLDVIMERRLVGLGSSQGLEALQLRGLETGGRERLEPESELDAGFDENWEGLQQVLLDDILDGAEVVCSTLIGCGSKALAGRRFDLVVVDEASQATEPRALMAVSKISRDGRIVFVGDHQQLPPVCLSQRSQDLGLGLSLFDRLLRLPALSPVMLTVQYRMHPLLSAWPSATFYGGRLLDGVPAEQRQPLPGFDWPSAGGVAFIDCMEPEESSPDGSKLNRGECALVCAIVARLSQHLPPQGIGVISPYRGQVELLNEALENGVSAATVDGFQGQERPVIVISCVRSNSEGSVGFLADHRRLNVALTRAQHGLIVVGNSATLRRDRNWRSWLQFVKEHELTVDARDVQPAQLAA